VIVDEFLDLLAQGFPIIGQMVEDGVDIVHFLVGDDLVAEVVVSEPEPAR
jgi:hypothetical protein